MNPIKPFGSIPFLVFTFILLISYSIIAWLYEMPQQHYRVIDEQVTVATSTEETARWKTYRNDEYGFQIDYPESLSINEKTYGNDYYVKFDNGTEYIEVTVYPADKEFPLTKEENGFIAGGNEKMILYNIETSKVVREIFPNLMISSQKGFTLFSSETESVPKDSAVTKKGTYVFEIRTGINAMPLQGEESDEEYENRFQVFKSKVYDFNNKALTSFKFTN